MSAARGHFERHTTRTTLFGGSYYAFCQPVSTCGWGGPWRRWEWLARLDGRRHERRHKAGAR